MSSVAEPQRVTRVDPVATLHDSLASMCRAGVPLPHAFRMLAQDLRRGPVKDAVAALASDIEDGVPFEQAYARRSEVFPAAYAALVSAGMAAGDLPGALAEVARHAERRARVARTLRRALAGPLISAAFVVVVGALLMTIVTPRFEEIDAVLGTPGNARETVAAIALGILAATIAATLAFAWYRNPLDGRTGVQSLGLRWPVIGRIRLYAGLSGALSTMASLVRRGVPLPEALDLAAATAEEPRLRGNLVTMAASAHDGAGLEDAARSAGLLPPSELWLIRAAHERGAPGEALDDLASHYTDRLDRTVARTAAVLTPAAELMVGVVVFVLAYTFVLPITDMAITVMRTLQ